MHEILELFINDEKTMKKQISINYFQLVSISFILDAQLLKIANDKDNFKENIMLFFASTDAQKKIDQGINRLNFQNKAKKTKITFRLNELQALRTILLRSEVNHATQFVLDDIDQKLL